MRIGLVGCGDIAENRHLPALQALQDVQVVAVADTDPDRLRWVADRFHVEKRHTDFCTLLSEPSIEAIAVCVPAHSHAAVALAALDAGKHLFIEKPLALGLDEADQLIERAARSPNKVMVGFNLRWHRLVRQAREMIQRGVLGSLELMVSVATTGVRHQQNVSEWRKRRGLGGGVLFEDASHYFDLSRFLFQSNVEEIFAASHSEHWDDVTGSVTFRMANDVLVTSVFSEATNPCKEIQIYGQAGCLRLSLYRFDGLEFIPLSSAPGDVRTRLRSIAHSLKELPKAVLDLRQGGEQAIMFKAQWRHFIDSIQRDTAPECTLEDGRHALQAALAAVKSASTGRAVRVAQTPREITPVVLE